MTVLPDMPVVDSLVIRGLRVQGDLAEALTDATYTVSMDSVGEIMLQFYDPSFALLNSGVFVKQGSVAFGPLRQEITTVETGAAPDGLGQTTVRCRATVVGALKRRTGSMVLRKASPSEFVIRECKAVGASYVVQPSTKRRQVARDTRKSVDASSGAKPSSWTTFERLARELGYVVFEAGGVIYFGKPSWLRKRTTRLAVVTWNTGADTDCFDVPSFRDSVDADEALSATVTVPRTRMGEFLPGARCRVVFPAFGDDAYLVTGLSFPIAGNGDASVTVGKPVDPKPEPPRRKGGGGGGGTGKKSGSSSSGVSGSGGGGSTTSRRLGDLLYEAGFRGADLKVATGVAVAESGRQVAGQQWEVDAKKVAGVGLQTSQWGPYVGLFQIRALTTSGLLLARGVDAKRVRSKLDEALYNAKLAKQIVDSQGWRAWPSYVSGRFSNYTEKQDAIVKGWGGMTVDTAAATSPTGRRSAYDFAQIALQQAGDRYVFGAEASKGDPNPSVFDCSELVEWAAARVGCYMPDGSSAQMSYMRSKGTTISVATAVRTRGALLWIPGHIAISLGNGRTIEAANSTLGVVSMSATARSFSWQGAGKVPGMRYG